MFHHITSPQALESSLRLDGVITVVDSLNVLKYLRNPETSHDVRMQLAFADRILLNKSDLVTSEQVCFPFSIIFFCNLLIT
jgi:G3E family GTPase